MMRGIIQVRRGKSAGVDWILTFKRCMTLTLAAAVISFPSAGRATADDALPNACKLASARDVGALITPQDNIDIRSAAAFPAPGEATCVWSAVQKALTDDAPPEGRLALAFYHMASPARAIDQMKRLTKTAQPPSLVRTEDSADQVLRTDANTVVARHGSDIVVIDARQVSDLARQRAGWTYRLEAMAFTAVGSQVLGPVDARATASVCQLAAPGDILALLTLSPSTLEVSDDSAEDGIRCRFNVRDASHEIAGWTRNHGSMQLRREDLGNNAAALERLRADRPFNRPSSLVQTADPTDRVVPTAGHPEEVEAVHGPYLVTLILDDPTDAAREHPSWIYRIQRAALTAAGATIIPPTDMGPDPVTPGPAPPPSAFSWRANTHAPPSWSWFSDPISHIIAFLARHRFILMPVLIGGSILFGVVGTSGLKPRLSNQAITGYGPDPPRRKARGFILIPICVGFAVINLIFGSEISGIVIYHFGAEGQATITGSHSTGVVYNNQNVRRHDVLLKTADGHVVETGFEDDDFNVYPAHNETLYPSEGDGFNVRYLQRFPQDFVILGEDDSPWAHDVRCAKLGSAHAEAEQKLKFAPDVQAYRDASEVTKRAEADAGCVPQATN